MKGCYRDTDGCTMVSAPSIKKDVEMSRKDFIVEAQRLNRYICEFQKAGEADVEAITDPEPLAEGIEGGALSRNPGFTLFLFMGTHAQPIEEKKTLSVVLYVCWGRKHPSSLRYGREK